MATMTIVRRVDDLGQDLRQAGRLLRRSPGFTLAVVLTLALGIGANTAVFSLIDGLLLHRLPIEDPDRLVLVADPSRGSDLPPGVPNQLPFMWSYRVWDEIRRRPELFERARGFFQTRFNLAASGPSELVDGMYVSGEFFDMLGVRAATGRTLTDADDRRDRSRFVVQP
jgi:hypothetical protein